MSFFKKEDEGGILIHLSQKETELYDKVQVQKYLFAPSFFKNNTTFWNFLFEIATTSAGTPQSCVVSLLLFIL